VSDKPESLLLRYLRRIDEKVDRLTDEVRYLKLRVSAVEEAMVRVMSRMDSLEDRFHRILGRICIADDPASL